MAPRSSREGVFEHSSDIVGLVLICYLSEALKGFQECLTVDAYGGALAASLPGVTLVAVTPMAAVPLCGLKPSDPLRATEGLAFDAVLERPRREAPSDSSKKPRDSIAKDRGLNELPS